MEDHTLVEAQVAARLALHDGNVITGAQDRLWLVRFLQQSYGVRLKAVGN